MAVAAPVTHWRQPLQQTSPNWMCTKRVPSYVITQNLVAERWKGIEISNARHYWWSVTSSRFTSCLKRKRSSTRLHRWVCWTEAFPMSVWWLGSWWINSNTTYRCIDSTSGWKLLALRWAARHWPTLSGAASHCCSRLLMLKWRTYCKVVCWLRMRHSMRSCSGVWARGRLKRRIPGYVGAYCLSINKRLEFLNVIQDSLDLHPVLVLFDIACSHFHHLRDGRQMHLLPFPLPIVVIQDGNTHRLFRRALFFLYKCMSLEKNSNSKFWGWVLSKNCFNESTWGYGKWTIKSLWSLKRLRGCRQYSLKIVSYFHDKRVTY